MFIGCKGGSCITCSDYGGCTAQHDIGAYHPASIEQLLIRYNNPRFQGLDQDLIQIGINERMNNMTWEEFQKAVQSINAEKKELTDITCPKCGKYIWRRTDIVLASYPPQYQYECECGWYGTGR